jgi:hypothetical protein
MESPPASSHANGAQPAALDPEQVAMLAAALAAQDMAGAARAQRLDRAEGEAGSRWRDAGRRAALQSW